MADETAEQGESATRTPLEAAREVATVLTNAGHTALFVGGSVRDRLLGIEPKDVDIATDAPPARIQHLFPATECVGAKFAVILVIHRGRPIEVATFRRDGRYVDHRHPETVEIGTLEQDAARRDFTINGLYEDPSTGDIIDITGGTRDLALRLVRTIGDPFGRFNEDALRMLRAVRFAARLGFDIERATAEAMRALSHTVGYIAPERIRDELTAMLTGPAPSRAIRLLSETTLLREVLPEVEALRGVEQGALHHPEGDVFEHTMLCLDKLEPRTRHTAWGVLLHDIGKPATFSRDDRGGIHFFDHERVGAVIAGDILGRLRFPAASVDHIVNLVRRHMMFMSITKMRTSTLRRFIAAETFDDDLAVHRADVLGSNGQLDFYDFAQAARATLATSEVSALPPPLVNGDDLIALGLTPGPLLGRVLRQVHDMQLEGAFASRDEGLEKARRIISQLAAD